MHRTDTDTGLATPEQVALVIADKRTHWDQNADDSDDVMLAAVRNAYALPGAQPVEDDGSALAAALIAFLTPDPARIAPVIDADTGRATPEQIALIVAFERNYYEENTSASVEQLLAGVRNTLTLPRVWVPGGFSVQEDGTDHADALIAFLTPAEKPNTDAALIAFLTPTPETPTERTARDERTRRTEEEWRALSPAEQARQIAAVERAENPGGPGDDADSSEPVDG